MVKEDPLVIDFTTPSTWFGVELSGLAKTFFFLAVLAGIFSLWPRTCSEPGWDVRSCRFGTVTSPRRSWGQRVLIQLLAFGVSSFYAGMQGRCWLRSSHG